MVLPDVVHAAYPCVQHARAFDRRRWRRNRCIDRLRYVEPIPVERDLSRFLSFGTFASTRSRELMLVGPNRVTALAGSLLLNLEAPFTVLLAVAVP